MRYMIAALIFLTSLVLAASAYSATVVEDYMGYADAVSRIFSRGDNNDDSGFRHCQEIEREGAYIGVICEGTRTIAIHSGQPVDVNYFCEFRFNRQDLQKFVVDHELCQ